MPVALGKNETCSRCKRTALVCNSIKRAGKYYHRECFICQTCKCRLEEGPTLKEDTKGYFYCLGCYMVLPSNQKIQRRCASEISLARNPRWGAVPKCAYCSQAVYAQDQRCWGGKVFHRGNCFRCKECAKLLEDSSVCDQSRDQLYCRPCWNKSRGTSQAAFSVMRSVCAVCNQECNRLKPNVVEVGQKLLHIGCLRCFKCSAQLDPVRMLINDANMYCRPCFNKEFTQNTLGHTFKSSNVCVECGKEASVQEITRIIGKVYHSHCLKCASCEKKVDSSTSVTESGKLYCRGCHTRQYKLQSARSTFSFGSNIEKCVACGKACYAAERVQISKSGIYHANCIVCSNCNIHCKSANVGIVKGKLYCLKKCYRIYNTKGTSRAETNRLSTTLPSDTIEQASGVNCDREYRHCTLCDSYITHTDLTSVTACEKCLQQQNGWTESKEDVVNPSHSMPEGSSNAIGRFITPSNFIEEETCSDDVDESPAGEACTYKLDVNLVCSVEVETAVEATSDIVNEKKNCIDKFDALEVHLDEADPEEACDNKVGAVEVCVDKTSLEEAYVNEVGDEVCANNADPEEACANKVGAVEVCVDKITLEEASMNEVGDEVCANNADPEEACAYKLHAEEVCADKEGTKEACAGNGDTGAVRDQEFVEGIKLDWASQFEEKATPNETVSTVDADESY